MARPKNTDSVWMENWYVLWWLGTMLGGAVLALSFDFPRNFNFLPAVAGWAAVMIGLGAFFDRRTGGKFSEGAFPFGTVYSLAKNPPLAALALTLIVLAIVFLYTYQPIWFLIEVVTIALVSAVLWLLRSWKGQS